jgi:ATP-dependent Clp protease ATP-binding subunit ClpX
VLDPLDVDMMTMILTEPKNAVARQFERLFAMDEVELIFSEEARRAIAEEALNQRTGARGLRTVVEELLLDVMFELPSRGDVRKCVISGETVTQRRRPLLATESGQPVSPEASEDAEETVQESA